MLQFVVKVWNITLILQLDLTAFERDKMVLPNFTCKTDSNCEYGSAGAILVPPVVTKRFSYNWGGETGELRTACSCASLPRRENCELLAAALRSRDRIAANCLQQRFAPETGELRTACSSASLPRRDSCELLAAALRSRGGITTNCLQQRFAPETG